MLKSISVSLQLLRRSLIKISFSNSSIGSRDNVEWNAEQEEEARRKVEAQAEIKMSDNLKDELRIETEDRWDKFYNIHQNR